MEWLLPVLVRKTEKKKVKTVNDHFNYKNENSNGIKRKETSKKKSKQLSCKDKKRRHLVDSFKRWVKREPNDRDCPVTSPLFGNISHLL